MERQRERQRWRERLLQDDPLFTSGLNSQWGEHDSPRVWHKLFNKALHSQINLQKSSLWRSLGWLCFPEGKQCAPPTRGRRRRPRQPAGCCTCLAPLLSLAHLWFSHSSRFKKTGRLNTASSGSSGKTDWGRQMCGRLDGGPIGPEGSVTDDPKGH